MLLATGILTLAGMLGGKVVNAAKFPSVTGYILIGVLLGPSLLGVITGDALKVLEPIQTIGFSLIAISVGGELSIRNLKRLGKPIIVISIAEVVGAFVVTFAALRWMGAPSDLALMFGALATATAPAATLAVCHECKADGDLTKTLLATVALDDAWAVISFAAAASLVNSLHSGAAMSWQSMLVQPTLEIGLAIAIGIVLGLVGLAIAKRFAEHADSLVISLVLMLLNAGLAAQFNVSVIMTGIVAGTVMVNFSKNRLKIFDVMKEIETPVYILFFSLAGAHLQLDSIAKVGLLGATYVIARVLGKMIGAWAGARVMKAPAVVSKYLGLTLLPQAGVAVGLATVAASKVPRYSNTIMTIVLASVVVYELTGPVVTRFALYRAGEAHTTPTPSRKANSPHAPSFASR